MQAQCARLGTGSRDAIVARIQKHAVHQISVRIHRFIIRLCSHGPESQALSQQFSEHSFESAPLACELEGQRSVEYPFELQRELHEAYGPDFVLLVQVAQELDGMVERHVLVDLAICFRIDSCIISHADAHSHLELVSHGAPDANLSSQPLAQTLRCAS